MARSKRTPEEIERRKQMSDLLKGLNIKDMNDINALFKEMVGAVLENGLEGELEEELGYSKYDYRKPKRINLYIPR